MNNDLLNLITCPVCKEKTGIMPDNNFIKCNKCGILFPVEDNIPIMLLSRSKKIDKA